MVCHNHLNDTYSIISLIAERQKETKYFDRIPKRYIKDDYRLFSINRKI